MHVCVLGPVDAVSGGAQVAVSTNQRLVLALLAADVGHSVSVGVLTEALWGDDQPANPPAALQNLISRIRSRMAEEDQGALATSPTGYRLDPACCSVDWTEFEALVDAARTEVQLHDADLAAAIGRYRAALRLWRGRPYAEYPDVEVFRAQGVRLEELRAAAHEELLGLLVRLDAPEAVAELEALVAREPFRERGHALLMEALARSGRAVDALRAYTHYRETLADELGLDPSPAMVELERRVLAGELGSVATAQAPAVGADVSPERRDNLAARRTSFVGREADVATVIGHLRSHRLVTIVGPGGAGKTSLGIEAARSDTATYAGGAWLVDLLQVADGHHIEEHVASTLALEALDPADPTGSLVRQLLGWHVLVILDNCEHVVDDVARLVDALLDGVDGARVLATSRVPLRVAGEHVCRIEPLALPPVEGDLPEVLEVASAQLFLDRIRAADTAFSPEDRDASRIVAICHRLDGLPLALELAAARVPSLGLAGVEERLDHRFGLLAKDDGRSSPHHRTLRAAIEWSVDLLDDQQRRLLARLSVFAGGFDLEAAEQVAAGDGLDLDRIPDALAALVERSLVVAERWDGTVRYRLLETIRELAAAILGSGSTVTRSNHRSYYGTLGRRIGDGFLVHTATWYARLRVEFPNLRTAFRWSMDQGDVGAALDLAASLRWAPFNTGHLYAEHREWIQLSLAAAGHQHVDAATVARGLVAAGSVAGLETRSDEAVAMLKEAVVLLNDQDDQDEMVWCYMWLGAFLADLGRYLDAVDHTARGLGIARADGLPAGVVYLANQHAENAMAALLLQPAPELLPTVLDTYELARSVAAANGIDEGLVRATHGRALLDATRDPERCLHACRVALDDWRRLGQGNRLIMGLVSSARVALLAGEPDTCGAMLVEAIDVMSRSGWRQPLGRLLETAAIRSLSSDEGADAALLAGAAGARFLTPRWYVPLGEDDQVARAEATDQAGWAFGVAAGRSMTDIDIMATARRSATAT